MEFRASLPPGDPRIATIDAKLRKDTTHAPGTNVNVNTAKPFLTTLAEGVGSQVSDGMANAKGAAASIQTAQTLMKAADSGKLIAGPGATFRMFGLQVGETLGVNGRDASEKLANTRQAMQSMAQSELDAAAQMKGQGQITEAERAILRRAASGDIDSLTVPEIRMMAVGAEKRARTRIQQHQENVKRLEQMPGAAAISPFFGVEEPPQYAPPQSAPASGVRRWNPQTRRLE